MTGRRYLILLSLSWLALLIAVGCRSGNGVSPERKVVLPAPSTRVTVPSAPDPTLAPGVSADYVGDAACVPCHEEQSRQHGGSRHASTVYAVTSGRFGPLFQSVQQIHDGETGLTYGVKVEGEKCLVSMSGRSGDEVIPARFAVGSGRYGHTFLGTDRTGNWYELRPTYYTQLHVWDYTPFLQPGDRPQNPLGLQLDRKQLAFCYSCHVTTLRLETDGVPSGSSHLGIGCERCHGACRQHIDAAKALLSGKRAITLQMEDLHAATRERNMEVCNACHSAPADIPKQPEQAVILARFAGTALLQSRCYLKSGTLSCLTCHDAHSLAAKPAGGYEAACLGCHSSRSSSAGAFHPTGPQPRLAAGQTTVCKVNPRSGCIGCHMPVQTTRSFARIGFHNHWIKVYNSSKHKS